MAFGRSNSLSLNTGATNSLFSQQNANQQNNAPNAAGSLFGGPAAQQQTSQPQQAGGLFGSANQSQSSNIGGGLFGGVRQTSQQQPQQPLQQQSSLFGNNASQPQQSGGLFGSSISQPQQTGTLFGSTNQGQSTNNGGGLFGSVAQTSQPQQQSSLFGNATAQPQQSGGLFGSSTAQPQPQQSGSLFGNTALQPQQSGGLFGSSTMPSTNTGGGTGLFSNLGTQSNAPTSNTTLFGSQQNTSLFGNNANNAQSIPGNSLFNSQNQQQKPSTNSIFGLNAVPASQLNQPTMLSASQYRQSQYTGPFQGKLSMGQSNQPATQTVGAVKVDLDNLRSTTRFADCIDQVKEHFEACDRMIQMQEHFCQQIEAMIASHGAAVSSLAPDVSLVKEKAEAAEQVLAMDAQAVESRRKTTEQDRKDFERCQKIVENQRLPVAYQTSGTYGGSIYGSARQQRGTIVGGADDDDLIGNYFVPMTAELQKTLDTYASNLTEIEGHMKVIEGSTVAQAQQLAAKRAGVSGPNKQTGGEQTVRELADTLRGFEHSILGVASIVGECREGVNELVLGKLRGGRAY